MRAQPRPSRDTRYFRFEKRKNEKGEEVEVQLGRAVPYEQPNVMRDAFAGARVTPDNVRLATRIVNVIKRNTRRRSPR